MKTLCLLLLLAIAQQKSPTPSGAQSCRAKLDYLSQNASREQPDPKPVVFTEQELNAYFGSSDMKLPTGVSQFAVELHPARIVGSARIDFDKVRAGRSDSNPLLGIFTGIHDVRVDSEAEGSEGTATIHVLSASVDGVNLPHFALDLFVRKYLQPKYPNVGLDTRFKMPARVYAATIAENSAELSQR